MIRCSCVVLVLVAAAFECGAAQQYPSASIDNGQLKATVYLPDAKKGFYTSTRFDWSGIVSSLQFKGHEYIGAWYQDTSADVLDYEYRGDKIVTGPATSMIGVAEVFTTTPNRPLGWDEANVGGNFIKVGVGVLRKTDDANYTQFKPYPIVDTGDWQVKRNATSIEFTQTIEDKQSGYGYVYRKRVALTPGKPQMTLAHALRNTGSKPIKGMVYNHNFLRWDNETPGPDYHVAFAYQPKTEEIPTNMPVVLNGRTLTFTRALVDRDNIRVIPGGFGASAADFDFRIENKKLGIGLRATADQPLAHVAVWGIRSAFAVEPFIGYDIQPGAEFVWTLTYDAYELQK